MIQPELADADAVFANLDSVARLFRLLQTSPFWESEGRRLPTALQEITGALAHTAFTRFPADKRRWHAGAMLFGLPGAFREYSSSEPSAAWSAMVLEAEEEILGAPDATDLAVAAAFRHASLRALNELESGDPAAREAALRRYDALVARLRVPEQANDGLPALIGTLEQLDLRSELTGRLNAMAASGDERVRAFAEGRLLVLKSREVPLDLTFEDIEGRSVDLAKMRGSVVLVQFWASWCGPCRAEIPHVRSARDRLRSRGFEVIGVSLDRVADGETAAEARTRVLAFMRDNGMNWPSHFDGRWWSNTCASRFGVRGIPASFLLDRTGRIAVLNPRGDDLTIEIERLLHRPRRPIDSRRRPQHSG